ncbi:MAG: endonuclease [Bacteroidota bacterium]
MKKILVLVLLFSSFAAAQTTIFNESFGTPSATTIIADYETANGFDNDNLTMTAGGAANTTDVRTNSTASTGYAGASGGGQVYFTATAGAAVPTDERGFAIEGINAAAYTSLKLSFAVRKEGAAGTAFANLAVQFWDGTAYQTVSVTGLPASTAAVNWYLVSDVVLPPAAQINGLKIKFVKTGAIACRLDDISLRSDSTGGGVDDTTTANIVVSALSLSYGQINAVPSLSQSFTVSGTALTDNILITPPAQFELSQNNSTWSTSPITLTHSGGAVATTTIYARYNPSAQGTHSGNITLTSTGVASQSVGLSGTYSTVAPPPASSDYYGAAFRQYGQALRTALHNIIKGHSVVSYDGLYTAFISTDSKPNGKVWDMYSDIPGGTPPYEYSHNVKKCGSYSGENNCYNREHSWCDSWLGATNPARSDLFHMYPTDGYVNNRRSNYPYGDVGSASWTSLNGCKVGSSVSPGYSGTVFEPINEYKGDVARSAMYMSVRYFGEDGGWGSSPGTNKSDILPWYASMLYSWTIRDTVSTKEINRNAAIFAIQKNRNPFIDHPEFAAELWFPTMSPSVVDVKQMNATTLLIDFSRVLDSTTVLNTANIDFGASGTATKVTFGVNNDYSKILVEKSNLGAGTNYSIQLKNVKSINSIAMNDTTVSIKTSGTAGVGNDEHVPQQYLLLRNYPNPFNPFTTVEFSAPADGDVRLRIFSMLGQEVAQLFNNAVVGGVVYRVKFDGSSLVSGLYFSRLEFGGSVKASKMMLLK